MRSKNSGNDTKKGKTLEWSLNTRNLSAPSLRARLGVTLGADKQLSSSKPCTSIEAVANATGAPKCSIELWAESFDGTELAYSRCVVSLRSNRGKVLWLGRSHQRPVHESVRGKRIIDHVNLDTRGDELAHFLTGDQKKITLAEALFGLSALIMVNFGRDMLELQAMDNGSGQLLRFYHRFGFVETRENEGGVHFMEGQAGFVGTAAPPSWRCVIPSDFDGASWLRNTAYELQYDSVIKSRMLHAPTWRLSWPERSQIELRLTRAGASVGQEAGRFLAAAILSDHDGTELAVAKATVEMEHRLLKVTWLGRSKSQPVHPSIRGQQLFDVGYSKVSAVSALVGLLGGFGHWLGLSTAEVEASDDGSGKLVRFFRRCGFGQKQAHDRSSSLNQTLMQASCETLAQHSCPAEWLIAAELRPSVQPQATDCEASSPVQMRTPSKTCLFADHESVCAASAEQKVPASKASDRLSGSQFCVKRSLAARKQSALAIPDSWQLDQAETSGFEKGAASRHSLSSCSSLNGVSAMQFSSKRTPSKTTSDRSRTSPIVRALSSPALQREEEDTSGSGTLHYGWQHDATAVVLSQSSRSPSKVLVGGSPTNTKTHMAVHSMQETVSTDNARTALPNAKQLDKAAASGSERSACACDCDIFYQPTPKSRSGTVTDRFCHQGSASAFRMGSKSCLRGKVDPLGPLT